MEWVKEITMVIRKYFYLNDNEILTSQNFMYKNATKAIFKGNFNLMHMLE